jgi:hypothetical protein
MITAPTATFGNVVAVPQPFGILFVCALLIGLGSAVPQFTESGRQATVDMQLRSIERFGATVTPEMQAQMEASSRSPVTKVMAIAGPLIMLPIVSLIFAALYWAIFNTALGGTASYKQVLAIVSHSQVIGAIGVLAALPIQLMKGTISMAGPFNLGALAPMLEPDSLLANVLGGISVFGIWGFIVTGIGLGVLYRRSGRNISIALIVVYVLFVVAASGLWSMFTGRAA